MKGKLAQDLLATRSEANVNLAPIFGTSATLDEVFLLEAAYQLDGAVMLDLEALGQIGDARAVAATGSAQRQH
jgi:hypothetical protein